MPGLSIFIHNFPLCWPFWVLPLLISHPFFSFSRKCCWKELQIWWRRSMGHHTITRLGAPILHSWVQLLLLDKNIHLNLPLCRTSFWSVPQILLKPCTVSPGIPARSQLSPALQLTVAWWASILMAASLGSASQSQHREIIKVLPFSESKGKHLIHLKGWFCWSGRS